MPRAGPSPTSILILKGCKVYAMIDEREGVDG